MTTVVYRDGILSADTMATAGDNCIGEVCKIKYINGVAIGCSGFYSDVEKIFDWYENHDITKPPTFKIECRAIIANRYGARLLESDYFVNIKFPVNNAYAIGTGHAVAIAAMLHGATAIGAVQTACLLDIYSRTPINFIDLNAQNPAIITIRP